MRNITDNWLNTKGACRGAVEWIEEQNTRDIPKLYRLALKDNKLDWINWGLSRLFNRKQRIKYAVYAAKQVLHIFEKECPLINKNKQLSFTSILIL